MTVNTSPIAPSTPPRNAPSPPDGSLHLRGQLGGLTAARGTAALVSFAWLALAARRLPTARFADLVLLLAVGTILAVVADAGLPLVLTETVAASPFQGRRSLLLVIRRRVALAVGAACLTGVAWSAAATHPSPAVAATYGGSLVATAVYTSCTAALRGSGLVAAEGVNEVASRVLVLAGGAMVLAHGGGLTAIVAVYALVDALSAALLLPIALRTVRDGEPADRQRFRRARLLPIATASFVGLVYYRVDAWLLALWSTPTQVARYAVSYRLLDGLMIPAGVLTALLVRETAGSTTVDAVARADQAGRRLTAVLLPLVAVLLVAPALVLRLAFGSAFVPAAGTLRILAVAAAPTVLAMAWSPLVALRTRQLLAITLASLVVNVGLNILLIPRWGGMGSAWATLIGQVAFAGALRRCLARQAADVDVEGRGATVLAPGAVAS